MEETKLALVYVPKSWSDEYAKGYLRGVASTFNRGVKSDDDYKVTRLDADKPSEKMQVIIDQKEYNGPCIYYEMEIHPKLREPVGVR